MLLIGPGVKNGILIAEFYNQLRNEVHPRGGRRSLGAWPRPILMTVIATVLGAVPLVLASARCREPDAIGTVIVGAKVATVLTLFTPVLYLLLAGTDLAQVQTEKALEAELANDIPPVRPPPDLREAAE